MANVTTRHIVKGAELLPNDVHTFTWTVNYGQLWWFWVDVVGADAKFEIIRTWSIKANGVWKARYQVKNIGTGFGFYNVLQKLSAMMKSHRVERRGTRARLVAK